MNGFNVEVSDKLPTDRKVPEDRPWAYVAGGLMGAGHGGPEPEERSTMASAVVGSCRKRRYPQDYPANLPTTTIIFTFHNEARSALYRSVRRCGRPRWLEPRWLGQVNPCCERCAACLIGPRPS